MSKDILAGSLFWLGLFGILFLLRPGAGIHRITCSEMKKKHFVLILVLLLLWTAGLAKVMSMPSFWNGEIPSHRDQYERITESFLKGHLYFDYDDIDPGLLEMENPYDRDARDQLDVQYHWDHAFYNGHYYMYFGVVPVFLLFLPYRLITGHALLSVHATQIFAVGFTLGVFALFWNLTKKFLKELPLSVYLSLSLILSLICIRYTIKFPALYHTAISAGLCLAIWSITCFVKAVWLTDRENKALFFAGIGSLLGALVFGCRPTIGLGNLIVIPLLILFLKNRPLTSGLVLRLIAAALPYAAVAALLMAYNQARFGNPFEFGQTYQLTEVDQSMYGNLAERLDPVAMLNGIIFAFAKSPTLSNAIPFISHGGLLWECPVLLLGLSGIVDQKTKKQIREHRLTCFMTFLILTSILIVIAQTIWSPWLEYRYCEDYCWLLSIFVFLCAGFRAQTAEHPAKYAGFVCWLSVACFLLSCLLILYPENWSLTWKSDSPEILFRLFRILSFGILG